VTEICEGIEPPASEPEEKRDDDKKPVTIRCIMLFDGTMNNKTNIESRISKNEFYESTRSKKYKVFGERVGKGADSYENGFTNIAALDGYMSEQPAQGYDLTLLIYTEGAGTINNKDDKTVGYGIGMGAAGVKNKCEKGIIDAVNNIIQGQVDGTEIKPDKHYIKLLTIDVFGFSRGATTARYAIHRLLKDEKNPIKKRLQVLGFDTSKVEVCFAGLFDTVSSHGISFSNDVRALELDAIKDAKKVLHLAAAEEYRKNFSLTNIKSASCKGGEEYFLPGVHSDVGGSYHDDTDEDFYLYSGSPAKVKADMAALIAQGWYNEDEILYEEELNEFGHPIYARSKANRKSIRNAYCQIPLKIMAESARAQGLNIKSKLETDANASISKFAELSILDSNICKYKVTSVSAFPVYDPLLMRIRHDHLHMSSKDSLGLHPRFNDKGNRWRQVYDG